MDYVGIDYCVDLACSSCNKTTRIRYSRLIGLVADGQSVQCAVCGRATNHDWTTASKARLLFREHFAMARLKTSAACG